MLGAGVANPLLILVLPAIFVGVVALIVCLSARLVQAIGLPGVRPVPFGVIFGTAALLSFIGMLLPLRLLPLVFTPLVWSLCHMWFIHEETRKTRPALALLSSMCITTWSAAGIGLLILAIR